MLKLACLVDLGFHAIDHFLLYIPHSACFRILPSIPLVMVQTVEFALDSEPTNDIDLISSLFYIILSPQTHYSKIQILLYKCLKQKVLCKFLVLQIFKGTFFSNLDFCSYRIQSLKYLR